MLALALATWLSLPAFATDAPAGAMIASAATWHLDHLPSLQRDDCSGLVESILERAGLPLSGSTQGFWDYARRTGRIHRKPVPSVGDLVFFDKTYDANRNGRVDDDLTHIAVVARVEQDGTIVMVHRGGRGIGSLRMNLSKPDIYKEDDRVLNDFLRARGYGRDDGPRLTGQLFRGFASITAQSAPEPEPRGGPDLVADVVVADPEATPPLPPGRDDVKAIVRARDGKPVRRRHLRDLSCEELWRVRNAIYARHGFSFETARGRAWAAAQDWYTEDPRITLENVGYYLTRSDVRSAERTARLERRRECR